MKFIEVRTYNRVYPFFGQPYLKRDSLNLICIEKIESIERHQYKTLYYTKITTNSSYFILSKSLDEVRELIKIESDR